VVRNARVPKEGLEPSHPKAQEPKSCVSTSSTTPAIFNCFAPLSADCALEPAYFVPQLAAGAGARYARASLMWSFAEEERLRSLLLSTAARDPMPTCQNLNTKYGAQILTSRGWSLHTKVSLELVDVTAGLHVVLRDGNGAVALLVDVDDERGADHALDQLAVEQFLPVRAVGVER
jgi:hypothetical protein